MESDPVIVEAMQLDHLCLSIFVRIVGPDVPEHEVKSEGVRRHAETTCLDGRSMAQNPTTHPILAVGRSSRWDLLAWMEACTVQSHDHPEYLPTH